MKWYIFLIVFCVFVTVGCDNHGISVDPPASMKSFSKGVSDKDNDKDKDKDKDKKKAIDVTIRGFVYNSCCGEWVVLSGIGHLVSHDDDGAQIDVSSLTGVWYPTESNYSVDGKSKFNVRFNTKKGGDSTAIISIRLKNANGCSFTLKVTLHMILNASGAIEVVVDRMEAVCE